ncbi:MAG TPA: tRNA(Ile)(2)-agmatinylcytidine synthase [Candidatus Bathyarchaeia archaeon]
MRTEFHIGIDDTDSRLGGCTTYTAALLFQELVSKGFKPLDFPCLVRLNPNIPWKTRGNGALSLHFTLEEEQLQEVKKIVVAAIERTTDLSQRSTDPAVVFLKGSVPTPLSEFSARALHSILSVREARHIAEAVEAEAHLLKGPRGLVGALASIGANFCQDHTFEIIAYRTPENIGTTWRRVNHDSVRLMDAMFRGLTFNNIDPETGRVLICPHGPDPVLLGIRGEDPASVAKAFNQIEIDEPIERAMIFKTNQGTDAHLSCLRKIGTLRPYQSTVIVGRVSGAPRVVRGGHVIFRTGDETGSVDCAAYRVTGPVRETALQLVPGDSVIVSGGIRPRPLGELTLNVEKLEVTGLVDTVRLENPSCSNCGVRCESMGKGQGFRCRKCKVRLPKTSRIQKLEHRQITLGIYIPPPRTHRHLTKPASRNGIQCHTPFETKNDNIDQTLESLVSISIAS